MARALAVALPQSQNLNQILGTHLTRQKTQLDCIFFLSSYTRIPNFNIIPCINSSSDVNNVHSRRLTSLSAAPLPTIPDCHHIIRSNCSCLCFPPLSLLPLRRSRSSSLGFSVMSQSDDRGPTIPQESTKTIRCVIKGRVQGVFYRNWTVENAAQLGLKGWVRNRRDGSVEALFSGKTDAVDDMLQRCRRGPPDAMLTAFEANPCNEDPGAGFERRPTV